MSDPLKSFRAARLEVAFRALERIVLPPNAGSTFRGAFGRAFRNVGCAALSLGATDCVLGDRCPYHYVFETRVQPGSAIMTRVESAPRPFVIEPPLDSGRVYEPGETLTLGLALIGRAIDYLPYFVFAFEELGRTGLGRGRGRCRLETVSSLSPHNTADSGGRTLAYVESKRHFSPTLDVLTASDIAAPPDASSPVTVEFLTPTRLHHQGRMVEKIDFHVLFRNVLRRVNFLSHFHCDGSLMHDAHELTEAARAVTTLASDLRWERWERYSARQEQRVPMDGMVGRVVYEGDLAPFWPWLALGEWVHVGKGATFGLGRYVIESAQNDV